MPFPVPFQMKVGNFTSPTADGPAAVTGVGFKPKAVVLLCAGNTSAAAWQGAGTEADLRGLMVSMFTAADEVSLFESSDDGGSAVRHGLHQKAVRAEDTTPGVVSEATLVSMDTDGFTLDWTVTVGSGRVFGYIALAGDSLLAKIVKWQLPAAPGTQEKAVTGVGFKPDLVLHMFGSSILYGSPLDEWPDGEFSDATAIFCIGAMDRDGGQWALGSARSGGAAPTDAQRSFFTDRAMYSFHAGAGEADVDAEFVSMDDDGFTLLFDAINGGAGMNGWVVSLALAGINAKVGTIAKPTSTQSQATTGIGFQPDGLILTSGMSALGTTAGVLAGFGAGSSSSARAAVSRADRDNVTPAVSLKRTQTDKILYGPDTETTHADLTSLDADGWTLAWTTSTATFAVGYIALGYPPRTAIHLFEMELNGLDGGWTDTTRDFLLDSPGVNVQYGITGTGPLDLTASTGTMGFALINSENNSAGKLGYYSPRHANCRPGFKKGIRVRYSYPIPGTDDGYGKFIGRLRDIRPVPGRYRDRKTICTAVDWINEAAITKYNAPTQLNKRTDEILATIVALVPRQPDSTSFDVADSTYPYALDNGLVEKSTVLTEIQRLMQSEYGRAHMHGGLNFWGRLFFEKRTARLIPSPVATFDGTMQDLDAGDDTSKVKNKAKVTAHPRRVDAVNTIVLFAKPSQQNPVVAPGATITMSGKYVDPSNPNARVGGTDMITPVATTDYLMNSVADGSGSNLTANFTVTAFFGANQVDFQITNNSGITPGYVTKLQVRGRGLYDYDPLEADAENENSIVEIGESLVSLDMPYQSDFTVTQAIAEFLVATWSSSEGGGGSVPSGSSVGVTEASIKRIPRTVDELTALMALEPGMAVIVAEDLSVVNDVYYIQNVGIKIGGDRTTFDFDLQRALVQEFWTLGVAGFSELGETTVLAPL